MSVGSSGIEARVPNCQSLSLRTLHATPRVASDSFVGTSAKAGPRRPIPSTLLPCCSWSQANSSCFPSERALVCIFDELLQLGWRGRLQKDPPSTSPNRSEVFPRRPCSNQQNWTPSRTCAQREAGSATNHGCAGCKVRSGLHHFEDAGLQHGHCKYFRQTWQVKGSQHSSVMANMLHRKACKQSSLDRLC